MRKFIAFLVGLAGLAAAIYVGAYLMFYGGIINIIDGSTASPVQAGTIAWGVVQVVLLAELLGWGIFMLSLVIARIIYGPKPIPQHVAS